MTSVDAPNAWAGIYHRRLADDGTLRFDERSPDGGGPAVDLAAASAGYRPSPWSAWSASSTAGGWRARCRRWATTDSCDFIDAFAAVFAELAADPDGTRFRPKAVRGYCTLVDST